MRCLWRGGQWHDVDCGVQELCEWCKFWIDEAMEEAHADETEDPKRRSLCGLQVHVWQESMLQLLYVRAVFGEGDGVRE